MPGLGFPQPKQRYYFRFAYKLLFEPHDQIFCHKASWVYFIAMLSVPDWYLSTRIHQDSFQILIVPVATIQKENFFRHLFGLVFVI